MSEEYSKTQVQELGDAIFQTIMAVKDGIQPADATAAMNLLMKFTAASDEIQSDSDAAVLDIVSGLTSKLADSRRNPPAVQ